MPPFEPTAADRREHYPRITPDELDEAGRALRTSLVEDTRRRVGGQPPIQAEDGTLNGPFGVFLFSPRIGHPLQELGAALRSSTSLTARERELAIVAVAAELRSEYELSVHVPIALASGIDDDDVQAVLGRQPLTSVREHVLVRFCRVHAREVAPRIEFEALTQQFDRQEVMEILALVSYYRGLASMLDLLRIRVDEPVGAEYAPAPARCEPSDAERSLALLMEEREITRLLVRLASCVDSFDFEGLARLYAEDGELITPWGSHRGRAGLAAHVGKDIGVFTALHHVSAGHEIDVVPGANRARARMTLLATHTTDDTGEQFSSNGGHYEIDLVREHGLWRLQRVRIVPAWSFRSAKAVEDSSE